MRDEKDPGTLDMIPAKRGRPCVDPERGPMTAAEKQRRYRELRKAQGNGCMKMSKVSAPGALEDFSDVVLLDALKADLHFIRLMEGEGGRPHLPARRRIARMAAELSRRYPQR